LLLSLRLSLDECIYSKRLVVVLQEASHYVETPADSGLLGHDDPEHFQYARAQDLILITTNPKDFKDLHLSQPEHSGIIAIYQDNRPGDLSPGQIVQALHNLETAGIPLAGAFHALNAWLY
jgi:predicted nuclease of predicted toxin-antitoxin system